MVRGLYLGLGMTMEKLLDEKIIVINEEDIEGFEVVGLNRASVVAEGEKRFRNPAMGLAEVPEWTVRETILVLDGVIKRKAGGYPQLFKAVVKESIPVREIVETLLKKGEELAQKGAEEGSLENVVKIGGLEFRIFKYTPPTDRDEFENNILRLFRYVAASRIRVMFNTAVFAEITDRNGEKGWYSIILPRVYRFLLDNPDAILQMGVIESGFRVPYIIAKGLYVEDLGTPKAQRDSATELKTLLYTARSTATVVEEEAAVEGELPI